MDHIVIDSHSIDEVSLTKFLGVILDNKFNWAAHCSYICCKMSKGIGIITKARKEFNEITLLSLYHSLILYLTSVTVFTYGEKHMTRIRKNILISHNNVLRVIAGEPPRTHTINLFVQFDIFLVKKFYVYWYCYV